MVLPQTKYTRKKNKKHIKFLHQFVRVCWYNKFIIPEDLRSIISFYEVLQKELKARFKIFIFILFSLFILGDV